MAEASYHRLTRTSRQFAVAFAPRVSLWLGSDHLLLVEHSGYTESYKRFYFRDIQAITVMETARRSVWNRVLAVPLTICAVGLALSIFAERSVVASITWAIFSAVIVLPLVVNNLRGTACTCQLRTAVQTEELASLSRVRQTQGVLDRIRPLIAAAQGQLTSEEATARMREAAATPPIIS